MRALNGVRGSFGAPWGSNVVRAIVVRVRAGSSARNLDLILANSLREILYANVRPKKIKDKGGYIYIYIYIAVSLFDSKRFEFE